MTTNEKYLIRVKNKLELHLRGFVIDRVFCMVAKQKANYEDKFEYDVYYNISHDKTLRKETLIDDTYFLENNENYVIFNKAYKEVNIIYEKRCYNILDFSLPIVNNFAWTLFICKKDDTLDDKWFRNGEYKINYTETNLELLDKL